MCEMRHMTHVNPHGKTVHTYENKQTHTYARARSYSYRYTVSCIPVNGIQYENDFWFWCALSMRSVFYPHFVVARTRQNNSA